MTAVTTGYVLDLEDIDQTRTNANSRQTNGIR